MTSITLDTLPAEILQRILISGSTSNSLTLSRVCKYFHTLCTDPTIYVKIIRNGNYMRSIYWIDEPPHWVDGLRLNREKEWMVCAKWSSARERADAALRAIEPRQLPYPAHGPETHMTETMLLWLPELIVSGCRAALYLVEAGHSTILSTRIDPNTMSIDLITRLAFCDACRGLNFIGVDHTFSKGLYFRGTCATKPKDEEEYRSYNTALSAYARLYPATSLELLHLVWCAEMMPQGSMTSNAQVISGSRQTPPSFLAYMMIATLYVGMLYRTLRSSFQRGLINLTNQRDLNYLAPRAFDIPFAQLYASHRPPYTRITDDDLQSCFLARHLPVMISADYLADGEWIGYYYYNQNQGSGLPTCDAMMHLIPFEISEDYPDHCTINCRGDDGCGTFSLFGTCHKKSGWVQMTKQYDHNVTWVWSAIMTPFGIVGTWGTDRGYRQFGWLWLWKKSWSVPIDQ